MVSFRRFDQRGNEKLNKSYMKGDTCISRLFWKIERLNWLQHLATIKRCFGSNDKFFSISLNWNTLPSCLAYLTYRFDNHCILLFRNQNQLKVAQRFILQQVFFGENDNSSKKTHKNNCGNIPLIIWWLSVDMCWLFCTKVLQTTMFYCLSPKDKVTF